MLLDVSPSMTESEMLYVVAASRSAGFLVCSFKPSKLKALNAFCTFKLQYQAKRCFPVTP